MRQFYLFPRIPLTELEISIFRVGRFLLFLNALSSGFSFLRNRNTWNIIIARQENDTGIISQRNCFERIELKKIEQDYLWIVCRHLFDIVSQ